MITLKQIAEELGVSVSMVSRVLTDKDRVDPEKRKLIKAALEKYNYVPNEMARGLRGISSRSFGIIVPTLASNYYTRIITAAQKAAQENFYTVITCCSDGEPEREREAVLLLKNKQIDKVMCASIIPEAGDFYKERFGADSAVLFDYDAAPPAGVGYVSFDSFSDAYRLAKFAASKEHKRFLLLNHCRDTQRSKGYLAALIAQGIDENNVKVISDLRHSEEAYTLCRKMLSDSCRPTCVLATNDFLAYSAVRAARAVGLSVPEELSVVCFDACDETGILTPSLTCVMQPTEKIGVLSAMMLINGKCEHIRVETDLVIGDSCK